MSKEKEELTGYDAFILVKNWLKKLRWSSILLFIGSTNFIGLWLLLMFGTDISKPRLVCLAITALIGLLVGMVLKKEESS